VRVLYQTTMEFQKLIAIGLPVALILVMIGVGLSLQAKDFGRVAKFPKAFLIGAICQLALLPLLAIGVISMLQLSGALALGVLIISLCPGGVTSNLFTYLAKGDVGLSVSLTAIVGFITPFTIPFMLAWGLEWQQIQLGFELPVKKIIIQLVAVTVVPVLIGMLLRKWLKERALKSEPAVRHVSSAVLALVIVALYLKLGVETVNSYAAKAGPACILLNLAGMALGLGIATLSKLNLKQKFCITLEVGLQNGTIALLITQTLLKNEEMTIAPCIYSLWMMVPAAAVVFIAKKLRSKELEPVAV